MFRRAFTQIATWLILSAIGLLLMVCTLLYVFLERQLQADGQARLTSEVTELKELLPSYMSGNRMDLSLVFADDTGQNIFFTLLDDGKPVLSSNRLPVSPADLVKMQPGTGFTVFHSYDTPYRMLSVPWLYEHHTYQLVVYTQTSREHEALEHVLTLMFMIGTFGILLSVGYNLWIANRALRPARETWNAYQDMLGELSHELQTPLATIRAIVETRVSDEDGRDRMKREINHASDIVQDMVYLSKLKITQPLADPKEPVAVSDLTEEVAERFVELGRQRSISVQGWAEPGLYVATTSEKWSRLISTLLKNAVDHAKEGTEAAWRIYGEGDKVQFILTNARGTKETAKTPFKAGLGLSIAERLASDMAGRLVISFDEQTVTTHVEVPRLKSHID